MIKAWKDIKSFVTISLTLTAIYLAVTGKMDPDQFYNLFLIVISFYFGTQYEKNVNSK